MIPAPLEVSAESIAMMPESPHDMAALCSPLHDTPLQLQAAVIHSTEAAQGGRFRAALITNQVRAVTHQVVLGSFTSCVPSSLPFELMVEDFQLVVCPWHLWPVVAVEQPRPIAA